MSLASFYVTCLEEQAALLQTQIQRARAIATLHHGGGDEVAVGNNTDGKADSKGKKAKKPKKVVDPNKPKKAATAYQLYYMENLAPYKQSHPALSPRNLMVEVGRGWSQLSAAQKQKYEVMAQEVKKEWQARMDAYNASIGKTSGSSSNSAGTSAAARIDDSSSSSGHNSSDSDNGSSSDSDSDSDNDVSKATPFTATKKQPAPAVAAAKKVTAAPKPGAAAPVHHTSSSSSAADNEKKKHKKHKHVEETAPTPATSLVMPASIPLMPMAHGGNVDVSGEKKKKKKKRERGDSSDN